MNRRNFLKSVGKAGLLIPAAPAICRAEWLMPVKAEPRDFIGCGFSDWCPDTHYSIGDIVLQDGSIYVATHCNPKDNRFDIEWQQI